MKRYDAAENLRCCIADIEHALMLLTEQIEQQRLLVARVFELPPIRKGEDHQPVTEIKVKQHLGKPGLKMALAHYNHLFMQHQSETLSTKSAVRLPGVICIEADAQQSALLIQQTEKINALKARLEKIITVDSGVTSEERFDFVHRQLHGLITLNAYRSITVLNGVDSVRFGWANKHIIKNVSRQTILDQLKKSLNAGRASAPWTREQWAEKLQEEINLINCLPENTRLKIKRPVKVQPLARVWSKEQQKQTQLACPSPLLVLCENASQLPKTGELLNYDAKNVVHRFKPQAETLYLLIPRLHLYGDRPG